MRERLHFEELTQKEQDRLMIGRRPCKEFLRGEVPFYFRYTFPQGETLIAFQDQEGIGHIQFTRDTRILFDVAQLLPSGFKFITPTYLHRHPEENTIGDYDSSWQTDSERKMIQCGEFQKPQDILVVLHEIGHAVNDSQEELTANAAINTALDEARREGDKIYEVLLREDEAKMASQSERRAWAWALRQIRNIQKKTGVDLHSLFPTFDTLRNFVRGELATYRRIYEWHVLRSGDDPSFYRELQTYFDRWQY